MRSIKILGLLTVMAVASTMAIGVGSASATKLCEVNTAPCPAGNTYAVGTLLEFELNGGLAVFKGASVTAQCSESSGEDEYILAGTPLIDEFSALTFFSCSFCKAVKALNLPWESEVTAGAGGNGTMELISSGVGTPTFEMSGCASNNTCFFESARITLSIKGGSPAILTASAVGLTAGPGSGALCGATGTWSATYEIVSPSPLFVI